MKTFNRICLEDYTVTDGEKVLELKRGKEYLTSEVNKACVTVFSNYWAQGIPVSIFGGSIQFTD